MKQKNKITLIIMLLAATSMLVQSCGKDNMKAPSSILSGRFTYLGQQVGLLHTNPDVLNNPGQGNILLQQVKGAQDSYGVGNVNLYAKHDGTFTGNFYNGEYLAATPTNKMPFEDFSNKPVTVNGDTNLGNIEVVPYLWVSNFAYTYTGGVFTATFNISKISTNPAKTLQYVAIYLSPTNTPDVFSATNGAARTFNAGTNAGGIIVPTTASSSGACTVKLDMSTLTSGEKQFLRAFGGSGTVWASVGVKTNTITDALYSDAIKLELP